MPVHTRAGHSNLADRTAGRRNTMRERFMSLIRDESGQDLAEYGLLVALIAIVAVIGVTAFGNQIGAFFNGLGGSIPLP